MTEAAPKLRLYLKRPHPLLRGKDIENFRTMAGDLLPHLFIQIDHLISKGRDFVAIRLGSQPFRF